MSNDPLENIYAELQELKNDLYGNPQLRPPRQGVHDRLERVEEYIVAEKELRGDLRNELKLLQKEREVRQAAFAVLKWLGLPGLIALFTWLYSMFGGGTRGGP